MREFTGVGRRVVKEHIPKKHCNFDEPILSDKPFDNTNQRIYGQKLQAPMFSETYSIGKSSNPADSLPRAGKKTLMTEQAVSKNCSKTSVKHRFLFFPFESSFKIYFNNFSYLFRSQLKLP